MDLKNEVIELNKVTKEKGIQNDNDRNLGAIEESNNIIMSQASKQEICEEIGDKFSR